MLFCSAMSDTSADLHGCGRLAPEPFDEPNSGDGDWAHATHPQPRVVVRSCSNESDGFSHTNTVARAASIPQATCVFVLIVTKVTLF